MHSDFADIGERPLICLADRQERNCHTTFSCEPRSNSPDQKCLLKTEQDLLRNEAGGFFISEPESEFQQNNSGGPSQVSIVQQQEGKEDPLVSGENIQIGFDLNVAKESRDFPNGGKGKDG